MSDSSLSIILDIETLAISPSAIVTEIAVLVFDRATMAAVKHFAISVDILEQLSRGRQFDPATYAYLLGKNALPPTLGDQSMQQASDAIAHLFALVDPHHVWIQGPDFDRPILENFLNQLGAKLPWAHWRTRDTRTVWDLAFPGRKHAPRPHTALADCHATLQDLRDALNRIGLGPDNVTAATLHPSPPTP